MKLKITISLFLLLFTVIGIQAQHADNVSLLNEKVQNFQTHDGIGIGMTITAMAVVFVSLAVLYISFRLVGKVSVRLSHKRAMIFSGLSREKAKEATELSGDVLSAIAMAIYEATELHAHDEENTILTIKNKANVYSPWSSKIYTLRELPNKR